MNQANARYCVMKLKKITSLNFMPPPEFTKYIKSAFSKLKGEMNHNCVVPT